MSDNTDCDALAVNIYSRPKLLLISYHPKPPSLPATQESDPVRIEGGKAINPKASSDEKIGQFASAQEGWVCLYWLCSLKILQVWRWARW